jgi:hypothetical protein
LVVSTAVGPKVTAAPFSATSILNKQVPVLFGPGDILALEYTVVVVEELPSWPDITTTGVADGGDVHGPIVVGGVGDIIPEVVFRDIFRSVIDRLTSAITQHNRRAEFRKGAGVNYAAKMMLLL